MMLLNKLRICCSTKVKRLVFITVILFAIGITIFYNGYFLPYNISNFFKTNALIGAAVNSTLSWSEQNSTFNFLIPHKFNTSTRVVSKSPVTPRSDLVVQSWEKCQIEKISEDRQKIDGRWFNFSRSNFLFYAYSAFIDNRILLFSKTPILRVIGLTDIVSTSALDSQTDAANFSCVLHFKELVKGKFIETVRTVKGMPHPRLIEHGLRLNGEKVTAFVFGCPLQYENSTTVWPKAVSITKINDASTQNCMPVEVPEEVNPKQDFVFCVAVGYGYINPWRLVQWFEMQRILGVSKIHMYDFSISTDALQVLRYYADLGILELYKMSPFAPEDSTHNLLHTTAAINDCMYRNINKFNYIVVIDVDEFILPVNQRNLSELVQYLDRAESLKTHRRSKPSLYMFLNAYYFMNHVHDNSTLLTYLRHRRVNVTPPPGYSVKSIVNSQACVAMHNHYCWTKTPGHSGTAYIEINVNVSVGANRHYKRCHFSTEKCLTMLNSTERNDEFLPYAEKLKEAAIPSFQKNFGRLPMEIVRNNISDLA